MRGCVDSDCFKGLKIVHCDSPPYHSAPAPPGWWRMQLPSAAFACV